MTDVTATPEGARFTVTTRDGRTLHGERHGNGSPVVVFESGMGASRNVWGSVLVRVRERTTAVAYDRSGLGLSPSDAAPRTLARLTDDLVDLLDHVGGTSSVLVGHSWGGPIVRSAAAARPDAVAGLVLVDQTDERCELFFAKGNQCQLTWAPRLMPALARTGVLRRMVGKHAAEVPEPWASGLVDDAGPAGVRTQLAELRSSIEDLRRRRDRPPRSRTSRSR